MNILPMINLMRGDKGEGNMRKKGWTYEGVWKVREDSCPVCDGDYARKADLEPMDNKGNGYRVNLTEYCGDCEFINMGETIHRIYF